MNTFDSYLKFFLDNYSNDLRKFESDFDPNYKSKNPQRPKKNYESSVVLEKKIPQLLNQNILNHKIIGSTGKGNMTFYPWICIFDKDITESATKGYYIVYLFKSDMSGVYLSLNQGWTQFESRFRGKNEAGISKGGVKRARKEIIKIAKKAQNELNSADDFNFSNIDLKAKKGTLGEGYELGNILSLYYSADQIPSEPVLLNDLQNIKGIYRELKGIVGKDIFNWKNDGKNESVEENQIDVLEQKIKDEGGKNKKRYITTEITRVIRDTELSKTVKKLYDYKCQICGISILTNTATGKYAEAAHIKPLNKHNGDDSINNVICLCPNHHVMLDYGTISINDDMSLLGIDGYLEKKHLIDKKYLKYHRENIFNG